MKLSPIWPKVVVQKHETQEKFGMILVPESSKDRLRFTHGKIIAMPHPKFSPPKEDVEIWIDERLKPGVHVLWGTHSGQEVDTGAMLGKAKSSENELFDIIRIDEIHAIIEDGK